MSRKAYISKEALYRDYVIDGLGIKTIAKKRSSSTATVRAYLKEYGIKKRSVGVPRANIPKGELKRLYEKEDVPVDVIADYFSVSEACIYNYVKKYNLTMRNKIHKRPTKEELVDAYVIHGLSLAKSGEIFGVSGPTVRKWLAEEGIPIRAPGPRR